MERTGLWVNVSSEYGWVSTPTTWFNIFSANDEEIQYANNKAKTDMNKYFQQRSSLRRWLRSWEKSTWDKKADNYSANALALSDWILSVLIAKWKDEKYLQDTYGKDNMKLIDITKWLEWWRYANDIDAFLNWDGTNLTGTLSKIFPETVAKIQEKEYVQPAQEEKNWWWRFKENFMWFMPKVAESANDVWNLIKLKTGTTDERSLMFWNYIYEKYWKNINDVPMDLLDKDYQQFMALSDEKKKEYMPTLAWAAAKWIEWVTDVVITATPWWAAIKWLLSTTWATPWLNLINEWIWLWVWALWSLINKIPWLSNFRDSLQSEKEKADWDAFMWWLALQKATNVWKFSKNLKASDLESAFETYKKWWISQAFKELSDKAAGKSEAQLQKNVLDKAQKIFQPENEAKLKSAEQWLEMVDKTKNIKKISTIDELSEAIDKEVETQKTNQMNAAKEQKWNISTENLLDKTPSEIVWWERSRVTTPINSMLDLLIDYYKDVDIRMVDKYKSYKSAIENWTIKLSDLLELQRDANWRWQKLYWKDWMPIDTKLADKFNTLKKWFNTVIDWLEWWENLRNANSALHNLYDLQTAVNTVKDQAFKAKWKISKQSAIWKIIWRMSDWLMFWAWSVLKRLYASVMQYKFKVEPDQMSSLMITEKLPKLIKEYKQAQTELQRVKNINEAKWIFNKFAKTRWLDSWDNFSNAFSEQKSWTPRWLIYWQYNDDAKEDLWNFFWKLEDNKEDNKEEK